MPRKTLPVGDEALKRPEDDVNLAQILAELQGGSEDDGDDGGD